MICYSCLQAEALGCEGNVDQAQKVMVLCEQMRDERTTLIGVSCFITVIRTHEAYERTLALDMFDSVQIL